MRLTFGTLHGLKFPCNLIKFNLGNVSAKFSIYLSIDKRMRKKSLSYDSHTHNHPPPLPQECIMYVYTHSHIMYIHYNIPDEITLKNCLVSDSN